MEAEIILNLDSYDRFFPNQDLHPTPGTCDCRGNEI